jgi:hypothetical protein
MDEDDAILSYTQAAQHHIDDSISLQHCNRLLKYQQQRNSRHESTFAATNQSTYLPAT